MGRACHRGMVQEFSYFLESENNLLLWNMNTCNSRALYVANLSELITNFQSHIGIESSKLIALYTHSSLPPCDTGKS